MYKWIVIVLVSSLAYGQDTIVLQFDTLYAVETNASIVKSDNMDQYYLVARDKIIKLKGNHDTLFTASNKLLGDVSHMDVSFGLKPVLFSQNQNTVSILDNTLSPQADFILLDEYDIFQATAVCATYSGNSLWIYNLDNYELIKLNSNGTITYRSGNLAQLTDIKMNVTSMIEFDNKLYVNDPSHGIHVFDIFGSFLRTYSIKNVETFQVFNSGIAYQTTGYHSIYSFKALNTVTWKLPSDDTKVAISKDLFYVLSDNRLTILKYK